MRTRRRLAALGRQSFGREVHKLSRVPNPVDLQEGRISAPHAGAGNGIGLAVTGALVDDGALVVAGSRSTENLDGLERVVTAVALDLLTPDGPAQLIERAVDEHGRIDVLVNDVGATRLRLNGFLATSDDDFEWRCR